MNKKSFLLGVVLLLAGHFLAAQNITTVRADNAETAYALADVQRVVFADNKMTVNMKSGPDVTDIRCIRFSTATGLKMLQKEASVWIFPNPVQTNLTVSGVDKDAKIKLFNLSGVLLQNFQAQENSTDIDVSSLPQGLYLLQVGEQMLKFIKR